MVNIINKKIPEYFGEFSNWKNKPIIDNDEPLISLKYFDKRIIVSPEYYKQDIPSALNDCYVRLSVADRLVKVVKNLPKEFSLLVFDGWRPKRVQIELFEKQKRKIIAENPDFGRDEWITKTEEFVSYPSSNENSPSPHITGGAVDLSICDQFGIPLFMGTEFDDFSEVSHSSYFEEKDRILSSQFVLAKNNRRLLYFSMIDFGFSNYPNEWWHFDFGNQFWAILKKRKHAIYGPIDLNKCLK